MVASVLNLRCSDCTAVGGSLWGFRSGGSLLEVFLFKGRLGREDIAVG